ncbi:MAG: hypothetical protein ACYTGZ_06995 [Planctomycetota bacterium]
MAPAVQEETPLMRAHSLPALGLAVVAAGCLALLVALVFRDSSEPARGVGARTDQHTPTEHRNDSGTPDRPKDTPGGSPTKVENDDNRTAPKPGTERWHYQEFLRRAAADPNEFDRLADTKIASGAPLEERIALLRAAWKIRETKALRWFSEAFAAAAGKEDKAADALRAFVVRHLALHADAVPEARQFLREEVFLDDTVRVRDRAAAGRAVLRTADPREISMMLATIRGISDADVAGGALIGLGLNDHADAASALTWLAAHHPQQRVRERAAELSRQRLAGEVGKEEDE